MVNYYLWFCIFMIYIDIVRKMGVRKFFSLFVEHILNWEGYILGNFGEKLLNLQLIFSIIQLFILFREFLHSYLHANQFFIQCDRFLSQNHSIKKYKIFTFYEIYPPRTHQPLRHLINPEHHLLFFHFISTIYLFIL